MKVESNKVNTLAGEMAGSAYGELMQNCVMYDEADNLYLACFHEEDNAFFKGILLRINKGETEFEHFLQRLSQCRRQIADRSISGREQSLVYARNDNADRPAADKQPGITLTLTTTPSSILPPEPRHA